jgi:hypothetical protein
MVLDPEPQFLDVVEGKLDHDRQRVNHNYGHHGELISIRLLNLSEYPAHPQAVICLGIVVFSTLTYIDRIMHASIGSPNKSQRGPQLTALMMIDDLLFR